MTDLTRLRAQVEQLRDNLTKAHDAAKQSADDAATVRKFDSAAGYEGQAHGYARAVLEVNRLLALLPAPEGERPIWACEDGDCRDHYGDPLAWCSKCREGERPSVPGLNHGAESQAQKLWFSREEARCVYPEPCNENKENN